jgi:hypothetical protein
MNSKERDHALLKIPFSKAQKASRIFKADGTANPRGCKPKQGTQGSPDLPEYGA